MAPHSMSFSGNLLRRGVEGGKIDKRKIPPCIVLAVFALIILTGCTLGGVSLNPNQKKLPKQFGEEINTAYDVKAKAILRNASVAAEVYCAENNGSYSGMDAAALSQIEPNLKFTDGPPKEDAVSVTASVDSYTLATSSITGKIFKAVKKPDQEVIFDFRE